MCRLADAAAALAVALPLAMPVAATGQGARQTRPPTAPAQADSAASGALVTLLARATTIPAGTYSVTGSTLEPSADPLPILVQADAVRGAEGTQQLTVSLGAQVARPAVTRARVVSMRGPSPAGVVELSGSSPAGALRTVHQLSLPPGDYELLAVVAESGADGPVRAALARSRLLVADLWRAPLALSPIVLGDAVAAAPPSAPRGAFVFGPTALRPATTDHFAQAEQLQLAFRAYNWTAAADQKPDLQVEYVFHEQTPRRAVFFNKVKPQLLNAGTLGERFDPASGAVNAGVTIPLAAFPPGEFRLTVRVTDNRSQQTASQETRFAVVP
jgi:hypothetical protein